MILQYWVLTNSLSFRRFSITVSLYWIHMSKSINKRINTSPHCFISIVGPGSCGKTQVVSQMLQNQRKIFKPSLLLRASDNRTSIEFHRSLQWSAVDKCEAQKMRTLLAIDNSYQVACEDKAFLSLVVAGRNRNIHLMILKRNLHQPAKNSKTIDLNVTQMILFKSLRDIEQIGESGRQMGHRQLSLKAYKRASLKPFGHMLIALDSQVDPKLNYSTACAGNKPVFYISTTKTTENKSRKLLYA